MTETFRCDHVCCSDPSDPFHHHLYPVEECTGCHWQTRLSEARSRKHRGHDPRTGPEGSDAA